MEMTLLKYSFAIYIFSDLVILSYCAYLKMKGRLTREMTTNLIIAAITQVFLAGIWQIDSIRQLNGFFWSNRIVSFWDRSALSFLIVFLATDLSYYVSHALIHRWDWLWKFHRIHHSDPVLNITSTRRHHLIGVLSSLVPNFFCFLLGCPPSILFAFLNLTQVYGIFLHSATFKFPQFLERIVVTPQTHRIHHLKDPGDHHHNFGGVLVIWDMIFGTYQQTSDKHEYGLHEKLPETAFGIWFEPFRMTKKEQPASPYKKTGS